MTAPKKHRYKKEGEKRLIEIRVRSAAQLFDSRDPAPFRERDLDDDFVEYIMSSANEFSRSTPLKICIYIVEQEQKDLTGDAIREAIKSHTSYAIELSEHRLKDFLRRGQMTLVMGLALLFVCIGIYQAIPEENPKRLMAILKEGIIIIGWVSMWRPIEILLYDWWPIYDHLRLLRKINNTEIEIKFNHQ